MKIHQTSSFNYLNTKDKAEPINKAIARVKLGVRDMAKVLFSPVGAAAVSLFLLQKKGFEKQCNKLKIKLLSEIKSFDKSSQNN